MRWLVVALGLSGCTTISEMDRAEQAWHALNIADGATTAAFCYPYIVEKNPLLGEQPSDAEVAAWIAAFSFGYHFVRGYVKEHHPDGLRVFDVATLAIKGLVVAHNAKLIQDKCP